MASNNYGCEKLNIKNLQLASDSQRIMNGEVGVDLKAEKLDGNSLVQNAFVKKCHVGIESDDELVVSDLTDFDLDNKRKEGETLQFKSEKPDLVDLKEGNDSGQTRRFSQITVNCQELDNDCRRIDNQHTIVMKVESEHDECKDLKIDLLGLEDKKRLTFPYCPSDPEAVDSQIHQHNTMPSNLVSSKKLRYSCDTCGKRFPSPSKLKVHMAVHTGIKPLQCELCTSSFFWKSQLTAHRRLHTDEKPFHCKICPSSFRQLRNMVEHTIQVHGEEGPHSCETCGKSFSCSSYLRQHQVAHSGNKPYRCKVCGTSYSRLPALRTHTASVHRKVKPYACGFCGKTFPTNASQRVHERIHTGNQVESCPICSVIFSTSTSLKIHMRTHLKKPFQCATCEVSFADYSYYKVHMKRHLFAGAHRCQQCGCSYTRKYNLSIHKCKKNSEQEAHHPCADCQSLFSTTSALMKHRRIAHSGGHPSHLANPFNCVVCEDSFPSLDLMMAHMRAHTGENN